jgi:hypothetical protein
MLDLRGWALAPVAAALLATSATATAATTPAPDLVVRLHDPAITESSGLVVGTALPRVLWTHDDGGSVADVYGVDERTGQTVARVRLGGIDPYDPEALAPGRDTAGRPALYLGDLGDNSLRRHDVSVFRVAEPSRRARVVEAPTWWHLTYPDGPHDAEALLVDPRDQRLYIATKGVLGGGLYVAPRTLRTDRPNPLTQVAEVPVLVTDGAFLPDGRFALRTYADLHVYDRPGHEIAALPLPAQQQGESVAVEAGGRSVLVGSEGVDSPVYRVSLAGVPAVASSSGSRSGSPGPGGGSAAEAEAGGGVGWRAVGVVGLVVAGLSVVAASLVGMRRRSRRQPAA